jgi:hypothetical protein
VAETRRKQLSALFKHALFAHVTIAKDAARRVLNLF